MRVLVVHNRYRSANPSGENVVVADEVAALRDAGVHVSTYIQDSDQIPHLSLGQKALTPIRPIASPRDVRAIRERVQAERIDVVHIHNVTPLISPAFIPVVRRLGVPVVQTVHNHRHVCVKGTFFRDGRDCRDCLDRRLPVPAIRHGCYQESRVRSVPMAVSLAVHHRTWRSLDRYLALTPAIRDHLVRAGIPEGRIVIRPNTMPDPLGGATTAPAAGAGFVLVSRLSLEKGIQLLLDAWDLVPEHSLGTLTVVGDGPDAHLVRAAANRRADIRVLGLLDQPQVHAAIRSAQALVIPSLWPDVFPRVVVEALALGRPVLATDVGGLPSIVDDSCGWISQPDPKSLAEELVEAARTAVSKQPGARARYVDHYSPDVVLRQLLDVYQSCLQERVR